MSNPIIRSTTRQDIETFSDLSEKPSIKAVCMEVDGRIIALGGSALIKGRWVAFVDLQQEARQYKMHILRAAHRFMNEMRQRQVRYIYAQVDINEPRSVAWLTHLGFKPDPRSFSLYRWSNE